MDRLTIAFQQNSALFKNVVTYIESFLLVINIFGLTERLWISVVLSVQCRCVCRCSHGADAGARGSTAGAGERERSLVDGRRGATGVEAGSIQFARRPVDGTVHGRVPDRGAVGASGRRRSQHVVRLADGVAWRHVPVSRASGCFHVRPQSPERRRQPSTRRSVIDVSCCHSLLSARPAQPLMCHA